MLGDYCTRLQELNRQKNSFINLKYKTNTKTVIQKQQNKYHKYILSQISYKNRLDSLFKINEVLRNAYLRQYLQNSNIHSRRKKQLEIVLAIDIGEFIRYSNSTLKVVKQTGLGALKQITQYFMQSFVQMGTQSAKKVIKQQFRQNIEKQTMFFIIEEQITSQQKLSFQSIKNHKNLSRKKVQLQNRQGKSFIFSLNQFSQIIPYTIQQESQGNSNSITNKMQEIDCNFGIVSLQRLQAIQSEKNEKEEYNLIVRSLQNLKDQVLMMRNVLSDKNRQIRSKDEQVSKVKRQYQNKIQALYEQLSDKIQHQYQQKETRWPKQRAKNNNQKMSQGYLKQLQNQIIGDRTPRIDLESNDPVGYQLIQKYMKQSFQMREKTDMARQMCQQFEFDSETQEGKIMMDIIKLLTPEERLNAQFD